MEISELKIKIKETNYLDNKKVGSIFFSKYKNLYNELINKTSVLNESYFNNKSLRARLIFLFKYDLNLNKITKNGKLFIFDKKKDDFVDNNYDYVKYGWEKSKLKIPKDSFSKEETINILKNNEKYKYYFGRSKNRILLNEDPKLYNSIYTHTKWMDGFKKTNKNLSVRLITLVNYCGDEEKIKCEKCKKNLRKFNYNSMDYNKLCYKCFHHKNINKFPQIGWFKQNYGDEWEVKHKEHLSTRYPTEGWFKEKYADNWKEELIKFNEINTLRLMNFGTGYSKISQKIFWAIYDNLTDEQKKDCYFKELNNEYFFKINNNFIFVDFKCGNKIIEFDGIYWHKNTNDKDQIRNKIYEKNNHDLLIINEKDLKNKKNVVGNHLLNKCLSFINNEY